MVESVWGVGIRALTDVFLRGASAVGTAAFLARQRATASPHDAAQLLRLTFLLDVADKAPAVRAPTLVLHREFDPAIRISHGRDLARRISGARFVALPGETHVPWDAESEPVLRQTELFLTGTTPVLSIGRQVATLLSVRGRPMGKGAATRYFSRVALAVERHEATGVGPHLLRLCPPLQLLRSSIAASCQPPRRFPGSVFTPARWPYGPTVLTVSPSTSLRLSRPSLSQARSGAQGLSPTLLPARVPGHDRGTVELAGGLGAWRLLTIGGDVASSVAE